MKALDPEKQLRRDSKGGGGDLHKPGAGDGDAKAKKHQTSRPRKPNKNKKDDDKKKLIAAGIGVAAVAGIGVTYAIAHNTGSKTASEKANEHSSDTGLNFGDDSDSESSSSSSKKSSKDLLDSDSDSSSKKSSKKKSSSKSKSKLDSLLDGDSDDSDTSLDTVLGDDFSQLGGSGSGSSLSALAAQAKKSASSAKSLGSGSGSGSSSKSSSSKSSKSSGKGSSSDSSPEVTEASNTGGSGKISTLDKKSSNGSTSTKVPAGSNSNVTNGKKTVEKTVNTPAAPSNGSASQGEGGSSSSKGSSNGGSSSSNGSSNGSSSSNSGSSSSNGGSNSSSNSGSSNSGSSSSKDDNKNSSSSNSGSKGDSGNSSNSGSNSGNSNNSGSSSTDTPSTDGSTETKTITYLSTYGDNLGQGKLTKTTKDGKTTYALDDSVPNGYWVSNADQLTSYPNYVTVQSVGSSTDENGNTLLTQKTVSYVDKSSGKTISQGIIYKWQSADGKVFCTADNLGNGYTVDLTDEELNKYPSVIYVTKQADFKYPAQDVADGTSKQVTVTTTDGTNVGTATLAKDGDNVTITGIPKGYHLSDLDDDGSQQLLYWPDTVTVVKDADQTYPADDIKAGTSKEITYRTSDGAEVGTGTITKNEDGSVSVSDIPGGYKLADLDNEGHSKQLLDWPDLVDVVKISSSGSESGGGSTSGSGSESGGGSTSGSGSESGGGSSSSGIHPSDSIAAGTTKAVDLVDAKTNQTIGTGKLTKQEDGSVVLTGIPQNYKLSDLDAKGHSPQLLNWPDSITVVSTSTTPSTPDNPSTPSTSESKEIPVVDADDGGKQIGTVKIVKNATTGKWTLDPSATLPEGYHLKDSEAVDSGPDKLELVKNSSGTDTPKPEETTKQVKFVDESGKDMGTGSLKQGDDGKWAVVKTTLPDGYKLKDSAAAESGPDQLVVVKVDTSTKPTSTSKQITYVDESGKEVGTATLIKEYDGTSNFNYKLDGKVPYGYLLKDEDQLKQYPDKVTVVADPNAAPKGESSKEVTFVLANGTEVGKGTLTRTVDDTGNAHFTLGTTVPKDYQVLNNDENVLKTYPDKIVVEKVTVTNTEVVDVKYVDEDGKQIGTGKMTVKTYSNGAKTWELDASIPGGWKLKDPLNGDTTITLVKTK